MKGKTNTIVSSNVEKASDMSTFFHGKKKKPLNKLGTEETTTY